MPAVGGYKCVHKWLARLPLKRCETPRDNVSRAGNMQRQHRFDTVKRHQDNNNKSEISWIFSTGEFEGGELCFANGVVLFIWPLVKNLARPV